MFLAYFQGPGGFRELREVYRNHFHRSWYLSDAVVTSYSKKPSWGQCFLPSTVLKHCLCLDSIFARALVEALSFS